MGWVISLLLIIVLFFQACASIEEPSGPRVGRNPASTLISASSVIQNVLNPKDKFANEEIAKFREQLPIKIDDYMTIVFVTYANETLFIVQKRNDYMGPRRFTLGVRYSHEESKKHICESNLLRRFLDRGIAIQYNYIAPDNAPLAQEIFHPEECAQQTKTSRDFELSEALKRVGI